MLDFRLRVFHSVANHLSFTKASNELYITQPAVTRHIKELEAEYDIKLFNRTGNKITLTGAGEKLLSYTDNIISLHNEIMYELSLYKGNVEGNLRVGASTTITQYVIPFVLARFNERFPDIKITLINGNTEYIENRLLKGEIDIGIVEGKPANPDIRYSTFLQDELVIFSGKNSRIKNTVTLEEFLKLPVVLRERGSGTLEIIEKYLQNLGVRLNQLHVLMFLGSTEAIKSFVKTGKSIGIVSRFAIEEELEAGIFSLINVSGIRFNRQFYFISPKGPEPGGVTRLFLNFLLKYYNL